MTLQNRVTPFGEILAIPQRGMFTGNRGIIHDPSTRTLLKRRWTSKAWLICACEFQGRRRTVMGGQSWTELFFLDEAIALAAGHRPCFFCRRNAALAFRAAWADARGEKIPSAAAMDALLHRERIDHGRKRIHPVPAPLANMPDGTVVIANGSAFTRADGSFYRWTEQGYGAPERVEQADGLLTPPSTYAALRAGYLPIMHPDLRINRQIPTLK
ncbi:hypothetical protein JJB09_18120 [Rhizobium sp. KVB221]|uniref:Uncharacterized protein n=1 Tax=Rhizobium setariae TaxID=2801340 RepID=A0A937CQI2_9HYPH|nr:hypothetical protein [Rhizobium setariae]MBL0373943.1 hypothetical protein [Rhizobium setariae]